jgi:hypothetical protein
MKWIYSSGGPFIFADQDISERWKGPDGLSLIRGRGYFPEIFSNDYEIACYSIGRKGDCVGLLGRSIDSVLVICGAQQEIGLLKISDGYYFIVKIEYSDLEDQELEALIENVASGEFIADEELSFEFLVKCKKMFIFDAGFSLSFAKI